MRIADAAPLTQPVVAAGVTPVQGGLRCIVRTRHARAVFFCLFDATGETEIARWRLTQRCGEFLCGFVPDVGPGARYGLRAEGDYAPERGLFFELEKLLVDPLATKLDRPFRYDGALTTGAGQDTKALTPKAIVEARANSAPSPASPLRFVYETPVKAFSMRDDATPPEIRGTLRALAAPHAIARLKMLGVSHVQTLPLAAWIDERHLPPLGLANAWGYNPVVFGALDPRLAPNGWDDLRYVTDALRAEKIGVIVDVVFNHTGESDRLGPVLSLRGLDEGLYYRRQANGALANDAGCGNSLDCTSNATLELILEALRRYVLWGGVDGFRFDLATSLARGERGFDPRAPLLAALTNDPVLRDRILIAEPWDVGENGYQLGAFPYPFIEWNDRFRDEVRRFWRGDANMLGAFATRIAGSADIFQRNGRAPSASLNFIAAHDGFALRDLVARAAKENHANGEQNRDGSNSEICWIANDARAAARALLASLFLSLGVPMLTAGDEFGRTQGGNNNAYAQDNEITWLDWGRADDDLAAFVGALSKARAQIPALNRDAFLDGFADAAGRRAVAWLTPEGAPMRDEDWREADALSVLFESETTAFWIALNRGRQARSFTPPQIGAARWRIVVSSNVSTPSDLAQSDHLDAPQCAVILLESRA